MSNKFLKVAKQIKMGSPPYEWKDKVVLITGAATGIGAHVVRKIVKEGVKHVAVLDVAEAAGISLENELNSKHGDDKVKFYKCDVTDEQVFLGNFENVKKEQGYIDVVINNAGIMNDSPELYKKEIEVNVTALVTGTLKAIEIMRKDQGGRGGTVINISSIAGLLQSPMLPIYFATKSAVLQFSNCIGMDEYYSRTGVRVLAICFGATDTPLLVKLGSSDKEFEDQTHAIVKSFECQPAESAAQGVVDAYRLGKSGSTWLATRSQPAEDISGNVQKAYEIMSTNT